MSAVFNNGQPWRQQYDFNIMQAGDITGWQSASGTPEGLHSGATVLTKDRVYILGGMVGYGYSTSSYYAELVNGVIGEWVSAEAIPVNVAHSQAIVTRNRVYILGGYSAIGPRDTVCTAPIVNGVIGSWSLSSNSLPGALYSSQAVVTKDRVYLFGGKNASNTIVSTVYTAPIDSEGIIGSWSIATSLPMAMFGTHAVVTNNRVYILGGGVLGGIISNVYTATIDDNGIIGVWNAGTALSSLFGNGSSVIVQNAVYLFGSPGSAVVLRAPINSEGIIGTWTSGTSLPAVSQGAPQAVVTSTRVYLLDMFISSTFYAPFLGGSSDYSERSFYIPQFWTNFRGQTELLI